MANVRHQDHRHYLIEGNLAVEGFDVTIPADFSSAVFPLAAGLITKKKIEIANLDFNDPQGDKNLFLLLQKGLPSGTIDVNDFIDGVPILAALACYAKDTTHLINAHPARFKESDPLLAMQTELQKMGAKIETTLDSMTIYPSSSTEPPSSATTTTASPWPFPSPPSAPTALHPLCNLLHQQKLPQLP